MHNRPDRDLRLDEPTRDRVPLNARTDAVNVRLEQIEKVHAELEARLEPVLAPSGPQPLRENKPDRSDDGSWLDDYLDATGRRLDQLIDSVHDLLGRVTL